MRSMTGIGLGAAPLGEGQLIVEIRSLNHRFQEVRVRTNGTDLSSTVPAVEQLCRQRLGRGRYDVTLRTEGPTTSMSLDLHRARVAFTVLKQLRDEVAPGQEVPLSLLSSIPDLLAPDAARNPEELRRATEAAFDRAAAELLDMREREGSAIRSDLVARLERVREIRVDLAQRAPELVETYRDRLRERVERLLGDSKLSADPHRLEVEVALLAEKTDVQEELVRLESHFSQLEALAGTDEPVGRKMDFLLQEITREANTIGSKCQDATVAHTVVDLKAETERMREQVQNVD